MWSDGQGLSAPTMSASTEERPRLHACFATTRWTIVAAARDAGSPENRAAWEELAKRYWRPVQAYIRGRCGDGSEADDLTQEFFARLIARDYLARVDPAKGPFRAFLRMAAGRFLLNEWDRRRALKRGGADEVVSLDAMDTVQRRRNEPRDEESAERIFERGWALTLLDRAFERLRADYARTGREGDFDVLKDHLAMGKAEVDHARLAERLGVAEGAARVALHRLRQRLRAHFRAEVAETVGDEAEVEAEMRHVVGLLAEK